MVTADVAQQKKLLQLQDVDTKLRQLLHKKANLPVIAEIAQAKTELQTTQSELATKQAELLTLQKSVKNLEVEVEQVNTKLEKDQKLLDAGGSAKSAQAIVHDIATLKERRSNLEDEELELLEQLEEKQAEIIPLEAKVVTQQVTLAGLEEQKNQAEAEIKVTQDALNAERGGIENQIEPNLIALYSKIQNQAGGLAVVSLQGRSCGGCRLELNPIEVTRIKNAAENQVVRCEECGRILIR